MPAPTAYKLGAITMFPRAGNWYCRYRVECRRYSKSTGRPLKDKAGAENKALKLYGGTLFEVCGLYPCPTLAEAFGLWERAHLLRNTPGYVENVSRIGRLHLGSLKDTRLNALTTAAVETELGRFLEDHSKPYANTWLKTLRLVCKWAVRRGMDRQVPFDVPEIRVKRYPKPLIPVEKARKWMEEVEFLAAAEPAIAMILRLQIGLGLRSGEARLARWEWLDFEHGLYTPGGTKGGKAWPRPVPSWILDLLRPLAKAAGYMTAGRSGAPITPERIRRVFDKATRAVGLPKTCPHRLRATYATWLAEEGVPIHDIQRVLEHKDIDTTIGYLGHDLGRVAAAQARIAKRTSLGR